MPTISEMKADVRKKMATAYGKAVLPAAVNDATIAGKEADKKGIRRYYLREQDAKAVRKACNGKFTVSFRAAGRYTLDRIGHLHPCKGHEIGDKSVKEKPGAGGPYTYGGIDAATFNTYQGLVGYAAGNNLGGIWVLNDAGVPVKKALAAMTQDDMAKAITGDYDMHDLIDRKKKRILGGSEEASAIEILNNAMLKEDKDRDDKVKKEKKRRPQESNYALIRHGAQTSYFSYLLGAGHKEFKDRGMKAPDGKILDQDRIANVSSDMCVFNDVGEAYILTSVGAIYKYYEKYDLLNKIPFYFFFHDLVEEHGLNLENYADLITKYMNRQVAVEEQ